MQNPEPDPPSSPKTGWTPTTSTVGGAILGTAVAQLITAGLETYLKHPLGSVTAGAISTVCIFIIGYFFPDGGRK